MKIKMIDINRDGGTISITADTCKYCIDNRLFSETKQPTTRKLNQS